MMMTRVRVKLARKKLTGRSKCRDDKAKRQQDFLLILIMIYLDSESESKKRDGY